MNLSNGDLILVKESYNFLEIFKNKELEYLHVGIIIKDPLYLLPSLRGLFVMNGYKSYKNDIADFNLEIIPIDDFLKKFSAQEIFIRKLKKHKKCCQIKLLKNYKTIYNYPLGIIPMEWFPYLTGNL